MDDYRAWIQHEVPRPTPSQVRAFAAWLSVDHSWYKHLPLHGPGEPFFVFLDPHMHQVWVDSEHGSGNWRSFVDREPRNWRDHLALDLQPGDIDPELWQSPTQFARGERTADVWEWRGRLSYWNFGPPGQPGDEAIAAAARNLRVDVDGTRSVCIPDDGLARGLVYLRGTIAPDLGPMECEYEELRAKHSLLPSHEDDRQHQAGALIAAIDTFLDWAYG